MQVLVLYMLFRGGAVVILKWFLYFMLLTPFIIPVFRYSLRWLMVPGKCPSCGIGFRAMRGKKTFACPSCRAPIEIDSTSKDFVRAAPSWEAAAGSRAGAAGGTPGGSAYNSGFASASAGSEAKGPGDSADIIDVDVIAIKSQDEP